MNFRLIQGGVRQGFWKQESFEELESPEGPLFGGLHRG